MSLLVRTFTPVRTALRRHAIAATSAVQRPIRPLSVQPQPRWISTQDRDRQRDNNIRFDPVTGKRIYDSPYDVPLAEQAKEVASDLKEKASEVASDLASKARELAATARQGARKAKRSVKESLKPDDDLPGNSRRLHTSSAPSAIDDSNRDESLTDKVKKGARQIKDSIKEATGTAQPTRLHPASSAFDEADYNSASTPVRAAAASSQLSTTAGRRGRGIAPAGLLWDTEELDEAAAKSSVQSLDEDQESVAKSLWDGPQEMPAGVGKRAKDEQGKPMETGTERS